MVMKRYDYFSIETDPRLVCRCCGKCEMKDGFMLMLDGIREDLGFPLHISSGYRCPAHDASVRGAGVHTTGYAVDIAISGEQAYRLVQAASNSGFVGIGINQHGTSRFVHLDTAAKVSRPRIWSY